MDAGWAGIAGTLAGGLVGILGTVLVEERRHRRERAVQERAELRAFLVDLMKHLRLWERELEVDHAQEIARLAADLDLRDLPGVRAALSAMIDGWKADLTPQQMLPLKALLHLHCRIALGLPLPEPEPRQVEPQGAVGPTGDTL